MSDPTVAPDRIWLQWHGDGEPEESAPCIGEVCWHSAKVFDHDVEYVKAESIAEKDAQISVLTAALAQKDEALREACDIARIEYAGEGAVWINNRSRKYLSGVDALSKELAALSAAPRDETCATCKGLREVRGDKPGDLMAWTMPCPDCKAKEGE